MPDLTTLVVLAGLFMSAIAGEAAIYSDTLRLQISVPAALQARGFNEAIAEEVFSAEAARIIRGQSIIPAPAMRIRSQPGILSAFAKPLNLDSVVSAVQARFGIDSLGVVAAIMEDDAKPAALPPARPLDMVLIVSQPQQGAAQIRLVQDDGDPVTLVRRAAQWSMERVAPYRVALAHFLAGTQGDANGFVLARQTATRTLIGSWQREQASERALLYNILGMVAAADNDLSSAQSAYRSIDQIPEVLPAVRAEVALNHAVVALALKEPAQAAALLRQAREASSHVELPEFGINLRLVEGLVAWANGDLAGAERLFRRIAADAPLNEAGPRYLGKVLAARGDGEGSARALGAALAVHSADPPQQGVAVTLFWVDPVAGGLTKRF